ncbi:unnamed protein product [Schistocephalus solidus]|uniref:Uncharacterized protein n=1 Tax=Schistocephalus solidus TaxID=70667 RepID=A0A183SA20_SCHSO|nr:unnamed protein product [Schistocephalus solidus]
MISCSYSLSSFSSELLPGAHLFASIRNVKPLAVKLRDLETKGLKQGRRVGFRQQLPDRRRTKLMSDRQCPNPGLFLQAVNTSPIATFGTRSLFLKIGLWLLFSWVFVVADIVGVHFLAAFDLMVDCRHSRLQEQTRPKGRLASHKHRGSTPPMPKPCQRAHAVNAHNARTRCNDNPTTSTSATPASDPTTTATTTTANPVIDAPPPTITDTILPPPPPAPIAATNTTCPTPTS